MLAAAAGALGILSYGRLALPAGALGGVLSVASLPALLLAAGLMLPVSFASGLLFTLLGKALNDSLGLPARSAGLLTLLNTLGAALGPIIAGFWLLVWLLSIAAIAWPESTVIMAKALGVGRGADLVLYCSVVAMLTGFFYIYGRFRRMDRQMTILIRQLAIENPLRDRPPKDP